MKGSVSIFASVLVFAGCAFAQFTTSGFPDQTNRMNRRGALNDQSTTMQVSGQVVSVDGKPVADAHVEARAANSIIASCYTDQGGNFLFQNLAANTVEILVTKGVAETHHQLTMSDVGAELKLRLDTSNAQASNTDGNATVSVAEYKVSQKARDALHKAQAALAKNRRAEAQKELEKALEISPEYADALTLRGVLQLDGGRAQDAVNSFDQAIHADPSYAMAYTALGAAYNQLQKFDDALRSCERAATLSPESWQVYFERAKSFVGKADYTHALQDLTRAQGLQSKDYAPIHLVRAHVMLALQQYQSAVSELEAFLQLAPQDPNSGRAREALSKLQARLASSTPNAIAR